MIPADAGTRFLQFITKLQFKSQIQLNRDLNLTRPVAKITVALMLVQLTISYLSQVLHDSEHQIHVHVIFMLS